MAKRRTPEEMKKIYMNCARILHEEGEAAVIAYLEEKEHYITPKATWFNIQRNETFKYILGKKKYLEESKEEPKAEETLEGTKADIVIMDEISRLPETKTVEEESEEDKLSEAEPKPEVLDDITYIQQLRDVFGEDHVDSVDTVDDTVDNVTKPPLGLMPRYIWIRLRIKEIIKAMARYHDADMKIPIGWIEELADLEEFPADIFAEDASK